ncbi:MAG: hypothetical protein RQ763_08980 [Sulfurimonas sp.]|uniref:hypothetical protein n=1 Tax=Sulfurimonas sp. TaxID=2022749 RepID=UPI0028CFA6F7|nr:hypothetical protein [Sulfurimonas sp.]MDT8339319.1 hypothetical protein [Sulfurimonas sp.]
MSRETLPQQLKELSETMSHIAQKMIYLRDEEITHHAYELIGAGNIALEWSEAIEKHIAEQYVANTKELHCKVI